ncbi:hypothetical protein SAMN04488128_101216 [Chitinophaga eiseniae]|uniref:Uncharacterized protein n=1 Tax=Chitinophaga eiseniae TaxID=634771 RepID=A0A1T4KMW2_9BACT|nr:hypothetical protein SAMN04488128_101216 [Chitinophaga eiseniae]
MVNFYGALKRFWYLNDLFGEYESENRKPQNLNSILLLCLYIRENSDYLDDLPNLNGRQKEGRRLLRMHGKKYKGKYPYQVNLDKIKERVRKLTGKEEHVIVKNIIDIQNKLMNQFLDVEMASSELGAYIQDLYDLWRGK